MKIIYKLIFLGLSGAMVAPMVIKGPDGNPLMTWGDWVPKDAVAVVENIAEMSASVADSAPSGSGASGKEVFYKWKDEHDVWQMTRYRPNHLPDDAIETRVIYANANIIKSLDSNTIAEAFGRTKESHRKQFVYNPDDPSTDLLGENENGEDDSSGLSLTTVPMKKIPELINQAQSMDANMKKRMEMIDAYSR